MENCYRETVHSRWDYYSGPLPYLNFNNSQEYMLGSITFLPVVKSSTGTKTPVQNS
jgi:hypothetical protein